jgi:ribosome modulation factor
MSQFDGMSRDELARAISEFNQNGLAGASSQPNGQKTAGDAYTESILQKPAGSWTQAEKDHIRGGINAALKDLGY